MNRGRSPGINYRGELPVRNYRWEITGANSPGGSPASGFCTCSQKKFINMNFCTDFLLFCNLDDRPITKWIRKINLCQNRSKISHQILRCFLLIQIIRTQALPLSLHNMKTQPSPPQLLATPNLMANLQEDNHIIHNLQ